MLLLFLSTFLSVTLAIGFLTLSSSKRPTKALTSRLRRLTDVRLEQTYKRQASLSLGRFVTQSAEWAREKTGLFAGKKLRHQLTTAGLKTEFASDVCTFVRLGALPLGAALGALVPHWHTVAMFGFSAAFWLAPSGVLRHLTQRRRKSIRRSIPDLVDLLVICVDAGLGLDQAVLRVAEELAVSHLATHEELMQVGGEQRAGKPRIQAWQDMAARLKLAEVDSFVSMLVQADRFGTPISRALATFAHGIRLRRTQAAEEEAAKTTVKILFPLVLFLFPTIFIVLLGPAVLTMIQSFKGGF